VTSLAGKALYRTTVAEQQAQVVYEPGGSADGHEQTPSDGPGEDESPTGIRGDVNSDGKVDAVDLQLVINAALGIPGTHDCDINGSGRVDAADVQTVIALSLSSGGETTGDG